MRTGELSTLSPKHVEVSNVQSPAALSLGLTKSGKWPGAAKSIAITVFDVVRRLKQWKAVSSKPVASSAASWKAKFENAVTELGLESFQFRPLFNSLVRGGCDVLVCQTWLVWSVASMRALASSSYCSNLYKFRLSSPSRNGSTSVQIARFPAHLQTCFRTRQWGPVIRSAAPGKQNHLSKLQIWCSKMQPSQEVIAVTS